MFKGFVDKVKKTAEGLIHRNKEELIPAEERQKKQKKAQKSLERTLKAMELAKKGTDACKGVSEKVGDAARVVTETAAPIVDGAAAKAKEVFTAASEKIGEMKEEAAKKPSTGSGLLDLIAPVVPDTDATKPKNPEAKKQDDKPPQP